MRDYILIGLMLTIVLVSGCAVTEESVKEINQRIEERYNSFLTLKYTITELRYEDGMMTQRQEYTEMFKKPDKIKQVFDVTAGQNSQNLLYVCNKNTAYSQITPDLMNVYEYINPPLEMTTYCGYLVNKGAEKWKIPMEITDETEYKVETSRVVYNGKDAIKAVVTILMNEEAKQKQIAIGKTPRETAVTYWFDNDSLAILKEESNSYYTISEASEEIGGKGSQIGESKEVEVKVERFYEGFYFGLDIPDSEFEIDTSDYPDVEFKKEKVDFREKIDDTSEKRELTKISVPMNTTITKGEGTPDVKTSGSALIAWVSACITDEDCTYVINPPTRESPDCINIEHAIEEDPTYTPVEPSPPLEDCTCKTLEIYTPEGGWAEDAGSTICRKKEFRPDLAIKDLGFRPSKYVSVGERIYFDVLIRNIGNEGCSQVITDIGFGENDFRGEIRAMWCNHYGYTPEQCEDLGFDPYFMPYQEFNASIDWIYSSPANYSIDINIFCEQPELEYSNNKYGSLVLVS